MNKKYFEWTIKKLLNSAFVSYDELLLVQNISPILIG